MGVREMGSSEVAERSSPSRPAVVVAIPCYDEASAIADVVGDFAQVLPGAVVCVYDNGSRDSTCERATRAGAVVRCEPRRGKGQVVRRIFADVDADVVVLVDGDGTYRAQDAPALVAHLLEHGLDMVVGAREPADPGVFPPGHRWGNRVLTAAVRMLFGGSLRDVLSGYRAVSRRFARSFPAESAGFEVETEMSIHALEMRLPVAECAVRYCARAPGSVSKLHTVRDGVRIGAFIVRRACAAYPAVLSVPAGFALLVAAHAFALSPLGPFSACAPLVLVLAAVVVFGASAVLGALRSARRAALRLRYLALKPSAARAPGAGVRC